ncbi:MAG: alpha/beta hydrolase [Desulfobacterales bacterium]
MKQAFLPKSRQIRVNGLELHYSDWGEGADPPVLLLHGFLGHGRMWGGFASQLRSAYHVLALDQRGHGFSGWSRNGAYSLDDHFLDIARFVECLDLRDLIVVGHSMGGRNALFFAACCPERVKGLVLVDARPANTDESILALKDLLAPLKKGSAFDHTLPPKGAVDVPEHLFESREGIEGGESTEISDSPASSGYDPLLITGVELSGYQVESLWPFMESLTCPTLVIRGENSTFLSREEARRMHRLIPESELVEIPGTSHMPMFGNPVAFNEVVVSFLNRLPV